MLNKKVLININIYALARVTLTTAEDQSGNRTARNWRIEKGPFHRTVLKLKNNNKNIKLS